METAAATPKRQFKLSKFVLSWYGILLAYVLILGIFWLIRTLDGTNGNNPIALKLGGLTFRWYGVIITCGVIIASFLAQFLAERRGDDPDHVWRLLPVLLVSGIGTARIWYVASTWENYKNYPLFGDATHAGAIEIWRGGIAIQGAVVGGIIGALVYGLIYNQRQKQGETRWKVPFSLWRFSDFVAPGLVLAQGIGRWGNFMNNEAYGRETHMPWGIIIPCSYRTTGTTPGTDDTACPGTTLVNGLPKQGGIAPDALFHPTFLYESLWDYFTFLVLFFCIMKPKTIERRFKFKLRDGDIFLLYWVVYSIGRFFNEGLRTDSLFLFGDHNSLRTAQVTALAGILVGGFLLFFRHRKPFPISQALSVRLPRPALAVAGAVTGAAVAAPADGVETNEAGEPVARVAITNEDSELDTVADDTELDTPTQSEAAKLESTAPPEASAIPPAETETEAVTEPETPTEPVHVVATNEATVETEDASKEVKAEKAGE